MHPKKQRKEALILITGSSGLIGTALINILTKEGIKVVGCDVRKPNKVNFIFEKCNLVSRKEVFRLFQKYHFSQVVHLASYVKFGNLSSPERKKVFQANAVATYNVVSAMKENNTEKIIFSSSMTVYGLPQYVPVDENHPLNPLDFYGFSKMVAEETIKSFGVKYFILRFPGIFSFHRKGGAIYNFTSQALKEKDIHILAKDPTPWDVIFIDDVINSIIAALSKNIESSIINVGYGEPIELISLAKKIIALCGSRSKVINDYSISHPVFCLDIKKSKTLLRFTPRSLDVRLHEFINFLKHEK